MVPMAPVADMNCRCRGHREMGGPAIMLPCPAAVAIGCGCWKWAVEAMASGGQELQLPDVDGCQEQQHPSAESLDQAFVIPKRRRPKMATCQY